MNGYNPSGVYGSGAKPVFESVNNYEGGSGPGASGFGTSGFGNPNSIGSGSFHSSHPEFYKKALKGSAGINSLNSINGAYGGQYSSGANYAESSRQDNFDCVCVPYDQCPARDILGRKGDLILPLDPRNLGSDIEAFSDESNSTSNANITRVVKQISESHEHYDSAAAEDDADESAIETTREDVKKVSKREISEKKSDDIQKSDGEAVSILKLLFMSLFDLHESFHISSSSMHALTCGNIGKLNFIQNCALANKRLNGIQSRNKIHATLFAPTIFPADFESYQLHLVLN